MPQFASKEFLVANISTPETNTYSEPITYAMDQRYLKYSSFSYSIMIKTYIPDSSVYYVAFVDLSTGLRSIYYLYRIPHTVRPLAQTYRNTNAYNGLS